LFYLLSIGKAGQSVVSANLYSAFATTDSFADKAVGDYHHDTAGSRCWVGRWSNPSNYYSNILDSTVTTADHKLVKYVAGTSTTLATEAVDITANTWYKLVLSTSGSTIKSTRDTAAISATDTSLASGLFGAGNYGHNAYDYNRWSLPFLRAPSSPAPLAQLILELDIEGSGKSDDPFEPSTSKNLVEIASLTGLPDFLYQEAKKYNVLKSKGFTDDEIKVLFGVIQHQVDLDSVTWGSFELHPDKASTAIIVVIGDNPYNPGAVERQKAKAKRVFDVPNTYDDAVTLYNKLKSDYPHWLVGKDNFAYQVLGLEIFDWMQNVDFYYGELLEHKTHYSQLKQVPDFEIRNRLNELVDKLSKVTNLTDERDKHITKAREVLRRGW
jgi:hypothetical protein